MKNARSKIMSAAMLSANVLTLAAPAIVHAAEQPSASTQSSIVQNKKKKMRIRRQMIPRQKRVQTTLP